MNDQQPDIFGPIGSVVEVGVGLTKFEPTDEQTTKARLRDLAAIGDHVRRLSVLGVCRGRTMLIQHQLNAVMQALAAEIFKLGQNLKKTRGDLASMAQLSHCLGYLSAQVTDSQRLLLETEKLLPPGDTDMPVPRVRSFLPGTIVGPAVGETKSQHAAQPTAPGQGA